MALIHRITIVGVAVLWLLTPTIACLSPLVEMAAMGEECCHPQAVACESMQMPQAQSCCSSVAHPDNASLAARSASSLPNVLATAHVSQHSGVDLTGGAAQLFLANSHSPPGADAGPLQILRI